MEEELDEQLALTVFGYTWGTTPKDAKGEFGGEPLLLPPHLDERYQYPPLGRIGRLFHVPRWSQSLDLCVGLVRKLNTRDVEVIIGCFPESQYRVELRRWRDRRIPGDTNTARSRETYVVEIWGTLEIAICKAVLRCELRLSL